MKTTIKYNPSRDCWQNGEMLAKVMQAEVAGGHCKGYFFDYQHGETATFKRVSPAMKTAAGQLMQAARDTKQDVELFRNMNGEVAAKLCAPVQSGESLETTLLKLAIQADEAAKAGSLAEVQRIVRQIQLLTEA